MEEIFFVEFFKQFPLVAKCGYIRQLVSESSDANLSTIELPDIPGGAEAFELAAKFCYGINFEISTENIAMLRCVSEYLEMTEDYSVGNLVGRTESYLNEVALRSLSGAISILLISESLLPMAETVKLVSRCIDTIAYMACKDTQFSMSGSDSCIEGLNSSSSGSQLKPPIVDWWVEDLTVLRIDIFQRVLIAMMARGFKQYALGPILMIYAQQSLRGLVRSHPNLTECFQLLVCVLHMIMFCLKLSAAYWWERKSRVYRLHRVDHKIFKTF